MAVVSYDDFKRARRFQALDGIRALAVMLVLSLHGGDHSDFRLWAIIDGKMGVTIFFVLSGFLITTLLLREQESRGTVSLKAFYVRRVMRLAPLYYLVLCVYILLIFASNLPDTAERRADMLRNLPFFLTYMSEYATFGRFPVFGQAWSLGIEEKFYLAWPSLAFLILTTKRARITAAVILALVLSLFVQLGVFQWLFGLSYAALFIGCSLALLMNERRPFERVKLLGNRFGQTIVVLVLLVLLLPPFGFARGSSLYAVASAAVIGSLVIGERSIWTKALNSRVMTYIGRRSYAVYLIHVLATHVVDRTRIFSAHTATAAIGAYLAILGLSLLGAEGLHRLIEGPCIRFGHAWSSRLQRALPVPGVAVE